MLVLTLAIGPPGRLDPAAPCSESGGAAWSDQGRRRAIGGGSPAGCSSAATGSEEAWAPLSAAAADCGVSATALGTDSALRAAATALLIWAICLPTLGAGGCRIPKRRSSDVKSAHLPIACWLLTRHERSTLSPRSRPRRVSSTAFKTLSCCRTTSPDGCRDPFGGSKR